MVDIRSSSGHSMALLRELVDAVGPLARVRLGALEGEAFPARLEEVHLDGQPDPPRTTAPSCCC